MLPPDLASALAAAAARDHVVLATDFDGVLAPLQDDPAASRPVPGSLEALRAAAAVHGTTVALVSGRDARTLRKLSGAGVQPHDPIVLVASHGNESSRPDLLAPTELTAQQHALLARLVDGMSRIITEHPPARIEAKPTAVVLHTRRVDARIASAARAAARRLATSHPGTHCLDGKDMLELGVVQMDKGTALRALAHATSSQVIVYFGDDLTDEKAFVVLDAARGDVPVKVGPGVTAAAYRLPDIPTTLEALRHFADRRLGHVTHHRS